MDVFASMRPPAADLQNVVCRRRHLAVVKLARDMGPEAKVISYLTRLGCSAEQAKAYLLLVKEGPQTVLGISRRLGTGRTRLYPLLQRLAEKQLIVVHERHYGTSYEALSPESLEFLVFEAERGAAELRGALPAVVQHLRRLTGAGKAGTAIREYEGLDGLKQVNWNLTRAEGEFMVFEMANLDQHAQMSAHFVEKLRQTWAEKGILSYDLTNNPEWSLQTRCRRYRERCARAAYIDPRVFSINFESYIYNDCVALVKYEKRNIVAVEIYDPSFAEQQKQLFWLVWKMAKVIQ